MIVVDASVLLDVLILAPSSGRAISRLQDEDLHAPHIVDIEVAQAIRRKTAQGLITSGRGATALVDLVSFPLERHSHLPLIERVWQLRHNLTAYDATYVALAELLHVPLLTRDGGLARAPGLRIEVELIR